MKILNVILKVVLCLIMVTPILGVTGIFPAPTADMYTSEASFAFISALMQSGYIMWLMAIVFALAVYLIATRRMALAALLILPITLNIVGFHLFLDGGLFTPGAIMADVLFALNLYFLYQNRKTYADLLKVRS